MSDSEKQEQRRIGLLMFAIMWVVMMGVLMFVFRELWLNSFNPNMDERVVLLGMTFLRELEFTQRGGELVLRQRVNAGAR